LRIGDHLIGNDGMSDEPKQGAWGCVGWALLALFVLGAGFVS